MPRYSPREELTKKAVERLVSLSSQRSIAQARAEGHDDVVPADLAPSARAYLDPRTGKLYSRTAVQTATTFYKKPALFRSMADATPERAARETLLDESGFPFPARDWSARHERDLKVAAIERAYRDRLRREGVRPPSIKAMYAQGADFRDALSRLSDPVPPGTKEWQSERARAKKTRALETLGLRPAGFKPVTGAYTPAQLAAAWRARGVSRPPQLVFTFRKTR